MFITVADTGPDATEPELHRRVVRLREHIAAGLTVWWRVQPPEPVHPPLRTHPKWHVFAKRLQLSDTTVAWVALCGHQEHESADTPRRLSFTQIKARQPFRCARCDALIAQVAD